MYPVHGGNWKTRLVGRKRFRNECLWNLDVLWFNSTPLWDKAAVVKVHDSGQKITFQPDTRFINFLGGITKFTIRFDKVSELYLTLSNNNPDTEKLFWRSVRSLHASKNLTNWQHNVTRWLRFVLRSIHRFDWVSISWLAVWRWRHDMFSSSCIRWRPQFSWLKSNNVSPDRKLSSLVILRVMPATDFHNWQ